MSTKKELKDAYKQLKPRMGVFQIRNLSNGKIFVEGSITLGSIWNRHRAQLGFGSHQSAALQSDWNALGENSFAFEVLTEIDVDDYHPGTDFNREINALESMYLEELQPYDERGYNRRPRK